MTNNTNRQAPVLRFKGFSDDWEQRKLNDIGNFYYGKSAPKWSVTNNGGIPCIRYGELYTKYSTKIDKILSFTSIDKDKLKFSSGHEVLIPRVGEEPLDFAKHASWLSVPNVAIGEMITVFNTKEDPLFIANYLRAKYIVKFAKFVEGGNVSNLYFDRYKYTNIFIPTKKEERSVSKLIYKINKLISLQQRKLNDLEQIKQALEDYIFPDNNENRKLIFNKNKWKHKKIKDIFEERNIRDGKENLLTVSISKGVVPFNSMKREINSSSDKSNYKVVKIGDIAYNSMRMWQGACGVSKYDGIVSPAYTVIRAKEHENALFYFYYFKNERMKFIFQKNSQGLTSDTWNLKFPLLKRITVLTPENEKEQIRVSKLFNKVSLIVKQTGKEIAYLNLVKKFLLQKMFF